MSVLMSRRTGTLVSFSGSSLNRQAHISGRAAFFAPEMLTSPSSGAPPTIASLSTRSPFFGGEGLHRQRMDFRAHAIAQRLVDALVLLDAALAAKLAAHDERLEMLTVT